MKLTFIGATHEVTGSCYFLQACGKNMLVDCGMEQGADWFYNQEIPVWPSELDYVFLTHAHMDHSGKLPLLYANGFRGTIFATEGTKKLCNIMLRDSAHIQEFEAEWRNRKGKRVGQEAFRPLYTMEDAVGALELFVGENYATVLSIAEGIELRFTDVGHLLGSASLELWLTEGECRKKLVFSGDIGNTAQPLIRDPAYIKEADYVIMESTYGDRDHEKRLDYVPALAEIMEKTFRRGGNLVIPSFAVGRTQEILYFIRKIKEDKLLPQYQNCKVYVDSPMAIEATNIFRECSGYYDEEAAALLAAGINPISFEGLVTTPTSEDSKLINFDESPKVIISASGMCEAGRIKHHLKHNLWRSESTILFVGYQANGTLGRSLLEGADTVTLFGEQIAVKAQIEKLPGISGHADRGGLIRWLRGFDPRPTQVFVTHGEDEICQKFVDEICGLGYRAVAPYSGHTVDLADGSVLVEGEPIRLKEKVAASQAKGSPQWKELLDAQNLLISLVAASEHNTNKELKKMAAQIRAICRQWE
ncbi:MAG: MBL fold metallo-hydrolase [Lachnospiraceae bacterium]|nr:MBL fold metallo-hydrolase [Lachnospiraceae bacterium]MDY5741753.1 MBL fold metallo-hydrolase [Lachnospiraceae bacterium]